MATTNQTVQSFYQTILQRTASAGEVAYWANQIDNVGLTVAQVENAFVTCPEAQTWVVPIVEFYQTYLGRAPDAAGLAAWVHAAEGGTSISTIAAAFAASPESQTFYGSSATVDATFVTKLYQTVLNRAPESAAVVADWVTGGGTKAQLEATFLASAEAQASLKAATNTFLTAVGNGDTSVYGSAGGIALYGGGGTSGNTFTLTTSPDTIPGLIGSNGTNSTTGDDIISGFVDTTNTVTPDSTLTPADNLNPGTGNNSLNVTVQGDGTINNALPAATMSNIKTLNVHSLSAALFDVNPALLIGVTALNADRSSSGVRFGNGGSTFVASGTAIGDIGDGVTINGALTANYATTATAATLNVKGGTTQTAAGNGPVSIFGAGVTSTTITSDGAANKIGQLTLPGTSTSLTVKAATNLSIVPATGAFAIVDAALATITVSGAAASVSLGLLSNPGVLTKVDASGLTAGGVSVDTSSGVTTPGFTFTGGGGVNKLILAAGELGTLTAGSQLNGGAGGTANTLQINDAALTAGAYGKLNATTNFQILGLGTPATVDASLITAAFKNHFAIANGGANTITNMTDASTVDVSVADTGFPDTFTPTAGATTLNLNIGSSTTNGIGIGGVTTTGFSIINLSSNGKAPVTAPPGSTNFVGFNNSPNTTFNIKGSENLNMAVRVGLTTDSGDTVNAAALSGNLVLASSAGADIITDGTGGSDITAGAGGDTVTLGAGVDRMRFLGGDSGIIVAPATTITGIDSVTGFTAGTGGDALAVTGSNLYFALTAGQQTAIDSAANLTAAASLASSDLTAAGWTAFTFGGKTYAEHTVAHAGYVSGTDTLVNLNTTSVAALSQSNFG